MSNIKTRKGLAFGALVALGASLIAGAPAHAANELIVTPSAGTLLSTLSTEAFSLKTSFSANANASAANITRLNYQVKSTSGVVITDNNGVNESALLASNPDHLVHFAAHNPSQGPNTLTIQPATNAAASVEVTAYVEEDNVAGFSAGDTWSTTKTITFKTLASVTSAVVLDTPHADDAAVTGQVTLDGINLAQIQSTISVVVGKYISTANVRSYNWTQDATVDAALKFTATPLAPLADGDNISARAYFDGAETEFATATKKVVAHSVFHITADVVNGPNAKKVSGPSPVQSFADVRQNSAYVVTANVKDDSNPDNLNVAGATVKAEFDNLGLVALSSTKTLTINGVTYTDNTVLAAAAISLTSDASGNVSLNVSSTGFAAGDDGDLLFTFTSENHVATVEAIVQAPEYTLIDAADKLSVNARSAVPGSTFNVVYNVVDQWGQAPANGDYTVAIDGDATIVKNAHADVVNGVATVPVAVLSTAPATIEGDSYGIDATLYKYGTNEHSFTTVTQITTEDGFELYLAPSAEITASTIKLDSPAATTIKVVDSADKFGAHDGRFDDLFGYAAAPTVDSSSYQVFSGFVKAGDAATHTIAGASVTISSPGQLIKSGDNYGVGSLTILAAADGSFSFSVSSHKSGAQTVTVTSGAATATGSANWSALNASTVSAVVASASYTTGRAVVVEFTAADKYGNVAAGLDHAASVTVVGQGYLVAGNQIGSTVTVTFESGKASVQLVDGADQIGTATVTLSTTVGTATKTAASTYTFGQTDANLNISGKRVTADWVFAAGKTVSITRDGVTIRTFHPTANSADSFSFNLKKSKRAHRVTIKVNGVTITDAGYLVKK